MLVLNRKKGETIVIGDNIILTIVDIQGDNIKIGIEAPRELSIYRKEIHDEIVAANQQASKSGGNVKSSLQALNKIAKDKS